MKTRLHVENCTKQGISLFKEELINPENGNPNGRATKPL